MTTANDVIKGLNIVRKGTEKLLTSTQLEYLLHVYIAGDAGLGKVEAADKMSLTSQSLGRLADKFTALGARSKTKAASEKDAGWDLMTREFCYDGRAAYVHVINRNGRELVEKFLEQLSD